jgi:DNA-binding NarL/FixJ family response regulator
LDIRMPLMNGMEAATRMLERNPRFKIIALTQYDLEENIVGMYIRGVSNFLSKNVNIDELVLAIQTVHSGGSYLNETANAIIRRNLAASLPKSTSLTLSELESQLLKLLSDGCSSTEIGDKLCKSPRTIEKYRNELYHKFGVSNKEQLIHSAAKQSLI